MNKFLLLNAEEKSTDRKETEKQKLRNSRTWILPRVGRFICDIILFHQVRRGGPRDTHRGRVQESDGYVLWYAWAHWTCN